MTGRDKKLITPAAIAASVNLLIPIIFAAGMGQIFFHAAVSGVFVLLII